MKITAPASSDEANEVIKGH